MIALSFFDVKRIVNAYEAGVGDGMQAGKAKCNAFPNGTAEYMAWEIGHEFGANMRIENTEVANGCN